MGRQPVIVDGSMGEGGGQILRTTVALSAVLGIPVKIVNIRAKRRNPGLRPQHLTAVKALATITNGRVKGLHVGSTVLEFYPGELRSGSFTFNIGTAGSISILLQALLPALAFAPGSVKLRVIGGTDVKMAPTIDYIRYVLLRHLERFGYNVIVRVIRRGHYPKGGGIVEVEIPQPPRRLKPVFLLRQGRLKSVEGISHCVRLPRHVAERQAKSAASVILKELGEEPHITIEAYEPGRDPHLGPGSGITLWAVFENTIMGADALGERGKRAEIVGREAAEKLVEDIRTGAAVDRHASDMLPVFMALADGVSEYTGASLTSHTATVFDLLRLLMENVEIFLDGEPGRPFKARIKGISLRR
jgi:RNA 3'-terminal phosphate cyclase (ATP)